MESIPEAEYQQRCKESLGADQTSESFDLTPDLLTPPTNTSPKGVRKYVKPQKEQV